MAELHGLSSSRSFIQQRSVGHRHACDVTDHGLIIEKRLQATLGDLRLVRRVLSHPEDKNLSMNQPDELGHTDKRDKVAVNQGSEKGQRNALYFCLSPQSSETKNVQGGRVGLG